MPTPKRRLTVADVHDHARDEVFAPCDDGSVGVELEFLVFDAADPRRRPEIAEVEAVATAANPLPRGGSVTLEPGSQLELSTRPAPDAAAACDDAAVDLRHIDDACSEAGIDLVALGHDPVRPPVRTLTADRYAAMENHFAATGQPGLVMMANTAAVQINVCNGAPVGDRWLLANRLAPVLTAAFANSPFAAGRPTGWASTRTLRWSMLDPTRAAPPALEADPSTAWAEYALAANVLLVRDGDRHVPITRRMPFGRWLADGLDVGFPTRDDLAYHLTTLFPPVRPRGWLEMRYLDALPTPFWHVATAVIATLLDDPAASAAAKDAVADPRLPAWPETGRLGLAHPATAGAAQILFTATLEALDRHGAHEATRAVVARFADHFVARSRCPADDRLDAWRRDGALMPPSETPYPVTEWEAAWR